MADRRGDLYPFLNARLTEREEAWEQEKATATTASQGGIDYQLRVFAAMRRIAEDYRIVLGAARREGIATEGARRLWAQADALESACRGLAYIWRSHPDWREGLN